MGKKVLMKGNEALAEAAVIAGCRYYFAYPITPQNEIPAYLSMRMPQVGGTFLQAESEIAAINMVFGAAAGGGRAMTSSSSPGISLKQEGISYLAGNELPAVVVNMMRGGPGLGNIAGSQPDYFQATKGGGHGDYHCIVLAPWTVQEMADLTVKAFDLADQYRVVVQILGDGYLGQMSEALHLPEPTGKTFDKTGWALSGAKGREPHKIMSLRLGPETALEKLNLRLQATYEEIRKNEARYDTYLIEDADYILAGFGTSARLCKSAINILRSQGIKAGMFRPITLWPFPSDGLVQVAKKAKKVLSVEMNAGQMVEDLKLALGDRVPVDHYGKMGGVVPVEEEIIERVKSYVN
jgi:2-oxoglutarate/2-oxoacid ferredoxin oxidoreductase subunit alpha